MLTLGFSIPHSLEAPHDVIDAIRAAGHEDFVGLNKPEGLHRCLAPHLCGELNRHKFTKQNAKRDCLVVISSRESY